MGQYFKGLWQFKAVVSFVLVLFFLPVLGYAKSDYISSAREYFEKNDYQAGIIQLKNALQEDPKLFDARVLLGQAYLEQGLWAAALQELNRALQIHPGASVAEIARLKSWLGTGDYTSVMNYSRERVDLTAVEQAKVALYKGMAALYTGSHGEAEKWYRRSIEDDSSLVEAYVRLGQLLIASDRLGEAEELMQKASSISPNSHYLHELTGDFYYNKGELSDAVKAYDLAALGAPYISPLLLTKRADALARVGDLVRAEKEVQKLFKAAPGFYLPYYLGGQLSLAQNDYETASYRFEKALELNPTFLPAVFLAGTTHYRRENFERAERLLSRMDYEKPNSLFIQMLLAQTYQKLGDLEGSERLLLRVLKQDPSNIVAFGSLVEVLLTLQKTDALVSLIDDSPAVFKGNSPEAIERLVARLLQSNQLGAAVTVLEMRTVISSEPNLKLALAYLYLLRGEAIAAKDKAQEILSTRPDSLKGYLILGLSEGQLGNEFASEAAFEKAYSLDPDDVASARVLGSLRAEQGRYSEAIAIYQRLVRRNPNDANLAGSLALLMIRGGELDLARKLVDSSLKNNPDSLALMELRGDIHVLDGKPDLAADLYQKVAQSADSEALAIKHAKAYWMQGARERAQSRLVEWVSQAEQNSSASRHYLAEIYVASSALADAIRLYRNILENNPDDSKALNNIAWLLKDKSPNEALKLVKRGIEVAPEYADAHSTLGDVYRVLNRPEESVVAYARSFELEGSAKTLAKLVKANAQLGRKKAACDLLTPSIVAEDKALNALYADHCK